MAYDILSRLGVLTLAYSDWPPTAGQGARAQLCCATSGPTAFSPLHFCASGRAHQVAEGQDLTALCPRPFPKAYDTLSDYRVLILAYSGWPPLL
eukprot:6916256-Heterocapsa_arctica.AAC.1